MSELDQVVQGFMQTLEKSIATLPLEEQGKAYRPCAENCVQYAALPELRRQFLECGSDLDAQYKKYGDTPYFFAEIIEPGHVYEMGYPRCVCPIVEAGFSKDPAHCECSRQSMLYVLETLLPEKKITVETVGTVLSGAEKCRFRVTVE